jgi:LDH2 family malate/lactate/ureidoglycolate dehydrogenase
MAIYPKSETDRRVSPEALLTVVTAIFARCGMSDEDAALLARTLVHADLRGVNSHGVLRVPDYVGKLTRGGTFAMRRAIERAGEIGIAFAAVRHSNHCGAMDWYTLMAVEAGMIGLAGTNALPTMAPWGGTEKVVGINPLSIAMPAGREQPFVLDFAFGATAHGKIRVYHQKGSPIPEGWAFDEEGHPTTDAGRALKGLIQPIGQHKGVGLGMAIGMLSSLLSGAGYGTETGNMVDGATAGRDGHFFAAINVSFFEDPDRFRERADGVIRQVHESGRREGVERLYVPGEIEADLAAAQATGITLAGTTVDDIAAAASRLNVDAAALFSGVRAS